MASHSKGSSANTQAVAPIVPEGTLDDLPHWRQVYNVIHISRCTQTTQCNDPVCIPTRLLIRHRRTCQMGKLCVVPNCWMFMKVLMHWCRCKSKECADCKEINRQIALHRNQVQMEKQLVEDFALMNL